MKYVLFVCTHNAGRSQIAQALFERYAPEDVRGESAGSDPARRVWPEVIEVMWELDIDLSGRKPKRLSVEMQLHADWAITMGCGDVCPYVPTTVDNWEIPDPAGRPIAEVREIRDTSKPKGTMPTTPPLRRRLLAELLGSAFLAALVIGSGIAPQQLSPNDTGLELFENAAATAGGLYAIILMFGPVSGGHFNGCVVRRRALRRYQLARRARLPPRPSSRLRPRGDRRERHVRQGRDQHLHPSSRHLRSPSRRGDRDARVDTCYLRARPHPTSHGDPRSGRAYIGAAYFFTSSASFANLAISVGRMLSNTFAGIAPAAVPAYIGAQAVGGAIAILVLRTLYPDVTPADAATVLLPHERDVRNPSETDGDVVAQRS